MFWEWPLPKPELGRAGVALRRFGQSIIELLANKRIHPGWVVPGGVTEPLDPAKRDEILAMLPEAYANIAKALLAYKQIAGQFKQEIEVFANFPSNYMALVNDDDSIEFTDGTLLLVDPRVTPLKTASPLPGSQKQSAKPWSRTAIRSSHTTSHSDIPMVPIAWDRLRD